MHNPRLLLVVLSILFQLLQADWRTDSYSCTHNYATYWCNGRYDYPYNWQYSSTWNSNKCYETRNGHFYSCYLAASPYYHRTNKQYYSDTITVYRQCHSYCASCHNYNYDHCYSCYSPYKKWIRANTCLSYCPGEGTGHGGSVGEYYSSGTTCSQCNAKCSWCQSGSTNCYACTSSYYLLDDQSGCTSRWTYSGYTPQHTCYSRQCISTGSDGCPDYYYFQVSESLTSTAPYSYWTDDATKTSQSGSNPYYRRLTNICHMCNSHCDTCNGYYQWNCQTCSQGNYKWNQYNNNFCQYHCPHGNFTSGSSDWVGEYTVANNRVCQLCDSKCVWCESSSTNCFHCKDNAALLDLSAECQARFNGCQQCSHGNLNSGSCNHTDHQCVSSCPTNFYFKLSRGQSGQTGVLNSMFVNWTESVTHTKYDGTVHKYRLQTNLCMMCDRRCKKCDGPRNTDCTECVNGFYKWETATICDQICPPRQYIPFDEGYPKNQTECDYCDDKCQLCEFQSHNCSQCTGVGGNYDDPNAAFLFAYNDSYSTCLTNCPTSSDPSTEVGYYGSVTNMLCFPCPGTCSNCNIDIIIDSNMNLACDDDLCTNGIVCTSCLTGSALVSGKCINEDNCRENSYYQPGDFSSSWSADNCLCVDGYSMSSSDYAKCSIKCDPRCKTCTGNGNNQCDSCEDGYQLSGSTCNSNNVGQSIYIRSVVSSGGSNSYSGNSYYTCGAYNFHFGYQNSISNKYFQRSFTLSGLNYYAVSVKMGVLFIDEWPSSGALYLFQTSAGTSVPLWTWSYNTRQASGQQMCGTNKMDYLVEIIAQIPTRNRTSDSIRLTTNQDLLDDATGTYYYWGIRSMIITGLKCHSDCSRCTGPLATDCITCASSPSKTLINGTCQCNAASNYYKWASDGQCRAGCDNGYYRDQASATCVLAVNCTPPNRFGYPYDTSSRNDGKCYEVCPSSNYASMSVMKCISDCSSLNEYNFIGATRTCEVTCPNGFIADPSTDQCVQKCPTNWYLKLEDRDTNPMCTSNCTTGWQYAGLQQCVQYCPNGYFKQRSASNHNQCVKTCVDAYGNNQTHECTLSCPFPTFADPVTKLCTDSCSDDSYFKQVEVLAYDPLVFNRTCVTTCIDGQYGNPFDKQCENYTTDCPDGYYGDDNVHLCVYNCTDSGQVAENSTQKCQDDCDTGYAERISRTCVAICPSDPVRFGRNDTKQCVSSCDFANTGLFGDAQAQRTCVQTCSDSPVATFGENATSLCVEKCTRNNEYGDPLHPNRYCVTICTSSPQTYSYSVTKMCVSRCPDSYFGDVYTVAGKGVCSQSCPSPYWADQTTQLCEQYCQWGTFGYPVGSRPCLKKCPALWYGYLRECVQDCPEGRYADKENTKCVTSKDLCSNTTYGDYDKRTCVVNTNCTEGTYADPFTKGCETSCSNGYFGDDNINTCVQICSEEHDEYSWLGLCVSSCVSGRFADFQDERKCQLTCSTFPLVLYGDTSTYRCVIAADCPTNYYANNDTGKCVNPCSDPFPYGDPISKQCVLDCPDGYYGDADLNLCVTKCNLSPIQFADNKTGNCQTLCTQGTFGVNVSASDDIPHCEYECPTGFARDSDRRCVADCGSPLYGDPLTGKCYSDPNDCSDGYYGHSLNNRCVQPATCKSVGGYFAQNSTKTCVVKCDAPNYGDSGTCLCEPACNQTHFGENTTRECLSGCSAYSSFAQTQNHLCVAGCSHTPISHFAERVTYTCVEAINCPTTGGIRYAQNTSRECLLECPANEWADITTKRCVSVCPEGYYADDSTTKNLCSSTCPGLYRYRDNSSISCVDICPESEDTFGDEIDDICVKTCPDGYFAQNDSNRRCVSTCKAGTWGNQVSRMCEEDPLECPSGTWADNFTHLCTDLCSASQNYYGNNDTKFCTTSCPDPTFAYDGTRVCIDVCPSSLTGDGYFGDPDTTPTRKCFLTCQTADLYRDVAASRTCVSSCTYNGTYKTYKDPTTMSCEAVCSTYPQVRYADDNTKGCETSCAGSLHKDDETQTCVSSCSSLLDPTTDKCVQKCPRYSSLGVLYRNPDNDECVTGANCPTDTYTDDDLNECVSSCEDGKYLYNDAQCVTHCPHDYFKDDINGKCVIPSDCPTDHYANNQTRSCVSECIGTFADTALKRCIDVCYGSKYGDPVTHQCQTSCSTGYNKNVANNSCVADCQIGLFENPSNHSCSDTCPSPYYADNNTRSCVSTCSANPITFASTSSGDRICVSACDPSQMHDMINRKCVGTCPSGTFAYDVNMSCVAFCPAPYYELGSQCVLNCSSQNKYSDDTTRSCVSSCPTNSYKDTISFKCVGDCPTAPTLYYISHDDGMCRTSCPQGKFADKQEQKCVDTCSFSPPTFAEDNDNLCVEVCPQIYNTFADYSTQTCVDTCPTNYYADSRSRQCVSNCSYLFADSTTSPPACVSLCSDGYFADELTYKCVGECPDGYLAHTPDRKCVKFCPDGYFADEDAKKCVVAILCPTTHPYADHLTHTCASECSNQQYAYMLFGATFGGQCMYTCPANYYSNPDTMKCQRSCPTGLFKQTTNNTCRDSCPQDKFMDSLNNQCVSQCPSDDNLFADTYDHKCVSDCNQSRYTFADELTRVCEHVCTGDQYADESSRSCVGPTDCPSDQYSDPFYKKCVDECYDGTYGYQGKCLTECPSSTDNVYANDETKTCVAAIDCADGTYADLTEKKCVQFCPISSGTFALDDTKRCVTDCPSPYYQDKTVRQCVDECPDVSELFGRNDTRECVQECPYLSFADETTNLCVSDCPYGYFADESTLRCVEKCPEGKFGNNITNYCVDTCPSTPKYFGDPISRDCVLDCPEGLFADVDHNRQCDAKCIGSPTTFAENLTGTCRDSCLSGFANERTQQCIAVCSSGYYGYSFVCYQSCPSVSPTVFADDSTNLCVERCPNNTYGDLSTRSCVEVCPISEGTFADDDSKQCTSFCPVGFYADSSTRRCVDECPVQPALFGYTPQRVCVAECDFGFYAVNDTRLCESSCPDGTYADNSTMKCVEQCPTKPMMYGDDNFNKCVEDCSADYNEYADNSTQKCVDRCPEEDNTYADPESRSCVATCPVGYFQENDTRSCERNCPTNTFADSLLRICVQVCSVDPVYYGDLDTWTCVEECPTGAFGNPLTQQCVTDVGVKSSCPPNYFGDEQTKICVEVCSKKEDLYADPLTQKCQASCPSPYVADNSTMRCVAKCPEYPSYFADLDTDRCVPFCPDGTFADQSQRECVTTCPDYTYAQNSTKRCISTCQHEPLGFADDSTWRCVDKCPDGSFADNSTLKCVSQCPVGENTFGQNDTDTCVRVCPNGTYADEGTRKCVQKCYGTQYGDNSSNMCVDECPRYPPYYGDLDENLCVFTCPITHFAYEENRTCLLDCPGDELYRQNSTNTCVDVCDRSQPWYSDNLTGYCVTRCSEDTYADPTTRHCVSKCPDQPLMYADNSSQSCVQECPDNTYGQNTTRSCVDSCPTQSLSVPQIHLCVRYCPIGYFAYNETAFCVEQCPSPYYGDPSTRSCVDSCPISQLLYADDQSRECVLTCPAYSYADKKSVTCIDECPDAVGNEHQTYAADYNNVCVEECSLPYFAYLPSKKCVATCPDLYYSNVVDHVCHQCPVECRTCVAQNHCTSCITNFYLQNGACVDECSQGYYANDFNMTCVSSVLCEPNFGINQTRQCSPTCPPGSYPNTLHYRCDACPDTCTECSSWTNCSVCENQTMQANDFCYPECERGIADSLNMYYDVDNETCLDACPNGTYLDIVYCKTCDELCTNCEGTAKNCTLCAKGLYLHQEKCVEKCPKKWKPTKSRQCSNCGDLCGKGLSFTTNTTQIDGKNTIFMEWSDNITINSDIYDVISLVPKDKRRLLAVRQLQQKYTIEIIDEKTIKIVILDDEDDDFEVQILQPQSIQDSFGNIPEKVRDQVQLELKDTYTTTVETASGEFSNYFAFLAAVCVISFLFDIQFMKFLQIIYLHYFVAMTLPPELSKVLIALQWSTLNYLPTLYSVPDKVLRDTVPGKLYDVIGDYSFLRTGGFALTPLAVIIVLWLLIKLLSVPEINRWKSFRIWCKHMLDQKFRYSFLYQWLIIMFASTAFFSILQMRDYTMYDTFAEVSVVLAHISLFFIVMLVVYMVYRIISFYYEYPKLSENIKKANHLILQENQYNLVNETNIFMHQLKKIDLRNVLYPKINNDNILPFQIIYRFEFLPLFYPVVYCLRIIIFSFIMVFAYQSTILQLSLLIALNFLMLLFVSKTRPFSFKFKKRRIRNYLCIFNQVSLLLFELLMLVLAIYDRDLKSSFQKEEYSYVIIYYLTIVCSVNFIYFVFRTVVQVYRKVWMPFTETQLFKNNFPEKYEEIHGEKKKKFVKSIDPKAKEALRALIKGYKKNKSGLRPTLDEQENPQLPMKYKITYFDRDNSSQGSKSSMTKAQRRRMIKDIFADKQLMEVQRQDPIYEEINESERTQAQYEEYEEEIEIKAKDLSKYIKNADQVLRIKRMRDQD